jgi:hypothetical protein
MALSYEERADIVDYTIGINQAVIRGLGMKEQPFENSKLFKMFSDDVQNKIEKALTSDPLLQAKLEIGSEQVREDVAKYLVNRAYAEYLFLEEAKMSYMVKHYGEESVKDAFLKATDIGKSTKSLASKLEAIEFFLALRDEYEDQDCKTLQKMANAKLQSLTS